MTTASMTPSHLAVESWAALHAVIITELEADVPTRHLHDGRPVEEALAQERRHLRAMSAHRPATRRVVPRVADKFGHVRVDKVTYSVPIRHAYRPVWVKLYHDRLAIAVGAEVVAEHRRAFCRGPKVLDALHVLPLLGAEAPGRGRGDGASRLAAGPGVAAGAGRTRQAHPQARPGMGPDAAADGDALGRGRRARGEGRLERHSPRLETVRLILGQQEGGPPPVCPPVTEMRPKLARIAVPAPTFSAYDALVEGVR